MHLSYCTGQAGIAATKASSAQNLLASSSSEPSGSSSRNLAAQSETPTSTSETSDDRRRKAEALFSKKRLGEGDLQLNESRLAEALQAERKRKLRGGEEEYEWGSGKKKKGGDGHEVTEEELGMSRWLFRNSIAEILRRGVQDESAHDGRSYGKLRRRGCLILIVLNVTQLVCIFLPVCKRCIYII